MKATVKNILSQFKKPSGMLEEDKLSDYLEQTQFVRYEMYRDIYTGMYRIRQCEDQLNVVFAKNLRAQLSAAGVAVTALST